MPDHQVNPNLVLDDSLIVYPVLNEQGDTVSTFISINTLFCDMINLYLIEDQTGPIRQLKTLDYLLSRNQNVYLIGHISPTTSSCSNIYAQLYRAILTKHSDKILGQFFGHTHLDSFIVHTNPINASEVTSFSLLGGSLSPLFTATSRFRVYELTK